jgi:AcrR family transcriptional regulator
MTVNSYQTEAEIEGPASESRSEILAAAARLISRRGYHAVSITDISQAVGLSKATIYHHFSSKEQILATIIEGTLRRLNQHIRTRLHDCLTPEDALIAFVTSQAEFFEANIAEFAVTIARTEGIEAPEQQETINQLRIEYESMLEAVITDGIVSGCFRPFEADVIERAVLALVYWLGRWYRPGGRHTATHIASDHVILLLQGLKCTPDNSDRPKNP